jgi:hypothetical protein
MKKILSGMRAGVKLAPRLFIVIALVAGIIVSGMLGGCKYIAGNISDNLKSPGYPENEETAPTQEHQEEQTTGREGREGHVDEAEAERIFAEYISMINKGGKPFELKRCIEAEIAKLPADKADEMILAFEEVQKVYESYYQQLVFDEKYGNALNSAASKGMGSDIINRIEDEGLKTLLKEVFNGGYKLVSREGSVYPVIDYSAYKSYDKFLSPQAAGYIDIMALESDKPVAIDAALAISWDELAGRLMKMEEFTGSYPGFARSGRIENTYNNYLRFYLVGSDNTPAYDYKTKKYKDEVISSFNSLVSKHEGSKTANTVKEYLAALESNNYVYPQNYPLPGYRSTGIINYKYINDYLAGLLPDKGYRWLYNGFAEYGHRMVLEDIVKSDNEIKYFINGKVADMSDGESGRSQDDFNIDLVYTISNGVILQTKTEKMMLDSDMDSIELIRAPLIKGNKWMQIAKDKEGKDRYLNCEITQIDEVGGSKVYTVEYRDQDSDYYEIRMIEEEVGVVSFTKLWKTEDDAFEIGYSLYKEMSGYRDE